MPIYPDYEVEISRSHLGAVLAPLRPPVVLMGGWAVYLLVNETYKGATSRDYLGSRDIDLGFSMAAADLRRTPFAVAMDLLTRDLGFRPVSFRLMKEIDNETGETLDPETAKRLPLYRIFQMYVDLVVDRVPERFRDTFGFVPPDEPLLGRVFTSPADRVEARAFGTTVWMPSPALLLQMKLRSFPGRNKEHKKVKDLADIAALWLYARPGDLSVKADVRAAFESAMEDDLTAQASDGLGLDRSTVETAVLSALQGRGGPDRRPDG
jgi:hypothetical protein